MPSRKSSLMCLSDTRPSCQPPIGRTQLSGNWKLSEKPPNGSPPLRRHYPQIPWKRIAGLRDVLIHDYLGVDISLVWRITQTYLPDLKHQVERY